MFWRVFFTVIAIANAAMVVSMTLYAVFDFRSGACFNGIGDVVVDALALLCLLIVIPAAIDG